MKKRLVTIITVILSVLMSLSFLSGCNLVTTNNERDVNQVVAEINVLKDEGGNAEYIYKSDMVNAYLNYGYYYVAYYGYSQSDVFETIINNLVKAKIVGQSAMKYFEANGGVEDAAASKWSADRYLTAEEKTEAEYEVIKAINSYIDNYEEKEDEKLGDTYAETVRTVPTDATNKEKDVDKSAYVLAGVITGKANGTEQEKARHKAYNKFIKLLESNSLLGKDYNGDITTCDYYKKSINSQYQSKIIEKFETVTENQAKAKLTFANLEAKYNEMYNGQKTKYDASIADFASAVSSNSASSPLVYTPYSGYGYVYNLLLGVSDEQKEDIEELSKTNKAQYQAERKEILDGIVVKDLRSSWILSGYDFDLETNKFTGDYTFTEENSLPFCGEVKLLNVNDDTEAEDYEPQYGIESIRTFGLEEFVKFMNNYVYGDENVGVAVEDNVIYRKYDFDGEVEDYEEKINELLFAFSTDSGSLNTFKGYAVTPTPEIGGTETYVEEFATAARELLTMGSKSYIIVGTDYGYHVMFYSEVLGADTTYDNLVAYLNATHGVEEDRAYWEDKFNSMIENFKDYEDTDSYLYILANSMLELNSAVTEAEDNLVSQYKFNKNYVNIYSSVYADLLG